MKIKVCFTLSLLIFLTTLSLNIQAECPNGQTPIRDGADLQYLKEGSFIAFKEILEIPNFTESKDITQTVSIYLDPKSFPRHFPKGKYYKVTKSSEYMLGADQFEIYFNPNEARNLGDLRKMVGHKIEFCNTLSANIAI